MVDRILKDDRKEFWIDLVFLEKVQMLVQIGQFDQSRILFSRVESETTTSLMSVTTKLTSIYELVG